jgi:hypothetical protein
VTNAVDIILEISDVADVCLDTVWQICAVQLADRFGRARCLAATILVFSVFTGAAALGSTRRGRCGRCSHVRWCSSTSCPSSGLP